MRTSSRNATVAPTVSFIFTHRTTFEHDSLHTNTNRLKAKLRRNKRWSGNVACVLENNRQALALRNLFTGDNLYTHIFEQAIVSVSQLNNYLIIATNTMIFSLDLLTKEVKLINNDTEEIFKCVTLQDGSIMVFFDTFGGYTIEKDLSTIRPIMSSDFVGSILPMTNGKIAVRSSGFFDEQDMIYIWDGQFTKRDLLIEPKQAYGDLIELYPNVLCFLGEDTIYMVNTLDGTSQVYKEFGKLTNLTKIKDGKFLVYYMASQQVRIYVDCKLQYYLSAFVNKVLGVVEPDVVAWQFGSFVTFFDVENRCELEKYSCKDNILCIIKDEV
jgi:hypothetical protein